MAIASQTSASPGVKPPGCSSQPSALLGGTNVGGVASHISLTRTPWTKTANLGYRVRLRCRHKTLIFLGNFLQHTRKSGATLPDYIPFSSRIVSYV